MNTDPFYTVKTLAEKLVVKPLTIYRLIGDGKLPAIKIGRSIASIQPTLMPSAYVPRELRRSKR